MNYSLVVNSKYNPFSYAELMDPIIRTAQMHQQLEDEYSALGVQASKWALANPITDRRTYEQYQKYMNDLNEAASQLNSKGVDINSRQLMLNLRNRYGSEIQPIEVAYARRKQLQDEQRQGRKAGVIYDYDAATTSLDKFLFDNIPDYDAIDTNAVYNKALKDFSNFSKQLRSYNIEDSGDPYNNVFVQHYGASVDDINTLIAARQLGDSASIAAAEQNLKNKALGALFNTSVRASGVLGDNWGEESKQKIYDTVAQAATAALGEDKAQLAEDYEQRKTLDNSISAPGPAATDTAFYSYALEGQGVGEKILPRINYLANHYSDYIGKDGEGNKVSPGSIAGELEANINKRLASIMTKGDYSVQVITNRDSAAVDAQNRTQTLASVRKKVTAEEEQKLKKKYGVKAIMRPDTYAAYKNLNFNFNDVKDDNYKDALINAVNSSITNKQYASFNVISPNDYGGAQIIQNLNSKGNNFKAYRLEDGVQKEVVKYSDVFGDTEVEKATIDDIGYTPAYPGHIIFKKNGTYYITHVNNVLPDGTLSDQGDIATLERGIKDYQSKNDYARINANAALIAAHMRDIFGAKIPSQSKTANFMGDK